MLVRGREFLERKGLDEARLEAELLVAHALGLDRLRLFLALERPVLADEVDRARALLVRRAAGEPVAYVTGLREFYGRDFAVDPRVLIPRPETELLIDLARTWHSGPRRDREPDPDPGADSGESPTEGPSVSKPAPRVLDVGTGSGCLAVTAALELEGSVVLGLDVSGPALEVARGNAERLGAAVEFVQADGPEGLAEPLRFDLVLSNPPYVTPAEAASLAPQVREHEPELALFAPEGNPDHWVRRLLEFAAGRLEAGGRLFVELGAEQGPRMGALARSAGFESRLHADLARIPRVLEAWR